MIRSTWPTVVPSRPPRRGRRSAAAPPAGERGEHVERERDPEHPRVLARDRRGVAPYGPAVRDRQRASRSALERAGAHRRVTGSRLAGDDHRGSPAPRRAGRACRPVATTRPVAQERDLVGGVEHQRARCVVTTVVRPARWARSRAAIRASVCASTADVGSTRTSTSGRARGPAPARAAAAGRRRTCGRARRPRCRGPRAAPSRMSAAEAVSSARVDVAAYRSRRAGRPAGRRTGRPSVSETTTRRRTSARGSRARGTPPSRTSSSTSPAYSPSRSASAADSSGCSVTTAASRPGADAQPGAQVVAARIRGAGDAAGCRRGRGGRWSAPARGRPGAAATRARISLLASSVAVRSGIIRNAE